MKFRLLLLKSLKNTKIVVEVLGKKEIRERNALRLNRQYKVLGIIL